MSHSGWADPENEPTVHIPSPEPTLTDDQWQHRTERLPLDGVQEEETRPLPFGQPASVPVTQSSPAAAGTTAPPAAAPVPSGPTAAERSKEYWSKYLPATPSTQGTPQQVQQPRPQPMPTARPVTARQSMGGTWQSSSGAPGWWGDWRPQPTVTTTVTWQSRTEYTGTGYMPGTAMPAAYQPYYGYAPWLDTRGQDAARTSWILGLVGLCTLPILFGPLALSKASEAKRYGADATAGTALGWINLTMCFMFVLFALGIAV